MEQSLLNMGCLWILPSKLPACSPSCFCSDQVYKFILIMGNENLVRKAKYTSPVCVCGYMPMYIYVYVIYVYSSR